ncbi:SurA N-terminal domain-containing protein [Geodermatophilus sabuli]|uniref:Peptidyl-prolyl cis-trans isomerase SurA n=1 Tax=Geodermatophilus sabuli TaxID=1564158 RepID=A0A285EGF4_9ACTN|nr:SurA N-terminal domain-containing protein [Geodermatophilus sabuli]MBB3083213.1 peptidyl-prolyl cis-trans isomerase SurA [Geodermatophilus sabuli]SNX98208.1 peptidyl-prolyl cis-trans isomerase SurA [Geodermatophilus sabuli]
MQTRRLTASLALGLVALAGVAGCRTSPNVAAYVGDEQVTVAELQEAVDQRLSDPALAAATAGREDEFTRLVLTRMVQVEVYAQAAEEYGVTPSDGEVRELLDELIGDQDPEALYAQAAAQGVGRTDIFETVRQQLVRQRIAVSEGLAEGLTEEQLRADYEEALPSLSQVSLGYVTVPDQAAADAAVATLQADPAAYPTLAAQYPSSTTLPQVEPRAREEVPTVLADQVTAAAPNTAFTVPVPEVGGVLVVFVGQPVVPSFEEVRGDLEEAAASEADGAAQQVVADVRADLDITVNPRYGTIEEGQIVPADGGVVDILEGEGATGPGTAPGADGAGTAPGAGGAPAGD